MKLTNAKIPVAGAALALAFLGGVAFGPGLVSQAAAQIAGGIAGVTAENRGPGGADVFATAAAYIGITADQLRTEMGTDKSMADVAVAHGKTRDGLIQALVAAETANIQQRISQLVDQKGAPQRPAGGPGHPGIPGFGVRAEPLTAASTYLGISVGDLQTQLRSGKTLAQIAVTAGKTRDGLIAAIVADETTKIDQAVKDGKLTADQATQLKANLTQRITQMVDQTGPMAGGPGFGFGRHGRP